VVGRELDEPVDDQHLLVAQEGVERLQRWIGEFGLVGELDQDLGQDQQYSATFGRYWPIGQVKLLR